MDLHVSLAGRGDRADRIYRQLLDAILDGRLRGGERLPPTRELARQLSVSRNTVTSAYDRLTADGFLVSHVGAGTFVCNEPVSRYRSRTAPRGGIRPRPLWRAIEVPTDGEPIETPAAREPLKVPAESEPIGVPAHGGPIGVTAHREPIKTPATGRLIKVPVAVGPIEPAFDFQVGVPDTRLFPIETWRRLVARELRSDVVRSTGYPAAGHPGLRAAIARYVGVSRSVRASADDLVVTQGAQQALDLVGRVLIEPGACVAVEEPGYQHVRALFHSLGARVVGVPVDAEGVMVDAIPDAARLVYTTPSHQFPLGTPMSLARRTALLEWAERHRAAIIEDDYDTEFRFSDRPLEPLQSLDRSGHVIYVGSFSKTMLPMLRVGFLVAPASLQPALRAAKQLADRHGEFSTQGALARFIDDGHLARHVRVRDAPLRRAARPDRVGSRGRLRPVARRRTLLGRVAPVRTGRPGHDRRHRRGGAASPRGRHQNREPRRLLRGVARPTRTRDRLRRHRDRAHRRRPASARDDHAHRCRLVGPAAGATDDRASPRRAVPGRIALGRIAGAADGRASPRRAGPNRRHSAGRDWLRRHRSRPRRQRPATANDGSPRSCAPSLTRRPIAGAADAGVGRRYAARHLAELGSSSSTCHSVGQHDYPPRVPRAGRDERRRNGPSSSSPAHGVPR